MNDKEKIQNVVRRIDIHLAGYKEQRRKHNELDISEFNYQFSKSLDRIIMTLQTIRDELIPKEDHNSFFVDELGP